MKAHHKTLAFRLLQPSILLAFCGIFYLIDPLDFRAAKVIHLIALISWFAGLFYLPRLFVYHAMATDTGVQETLDVMQYKLYHYIMQPALVVTVAAGLWMLMLWNWALPAWMHIKLTLVVALVLYHLQCGRLIKQLELGKSRHSHTFFRWFNEIPTLLLIAIVYLVVQQPG